ASRHVNVTAHDSPRDTASGHVNVTAHDSPRDTASGHVNVTAHDSRTNPNPARARVAFNSDGWRRSTLTETAAVPRCLHTQPEVLPIVHVSANSQVNSMIWTSRDPLIYGAVSCVGWSSLVVARLVLFKLSAARR
ncbi:hypothetical protein LSAT2_018983, partial [Lamellibrachia satsuma]